MATVNTEAPNTLLSNTTLNILDLVCEGPISGFTYKSIPFTGDPLMSTVYNDVPVRNIDGSYNYNVSGAGFSFQYMLGTSTQTGIPMFQKVESVIPLGANTLVSNPLPGAGPYKTVVAGFNTQMYPDVDSVKVTMRVPALFSQDDNGNTNGYNVGYAIDVALNDGPFTTMVDTSFNGKCTVPYLRDHVIVLPKTTPPGTYYAWKVRVRRTTTDIQSIRTQNAIYVDSMSLISSSLYAYPNSVMVATEISANQFSDIPARAYEVYGTLVNVPNGYTPTTYDLSGNFLAPAVYPTVWTGDFKGGVWTDNPAWIFYDLLTNPVHGLGDYMASGAVDKWTLYQLSQYCDQLVNNGASGLYGTGTLEPRFTCNVAIQQPEQAYTVLLNLASTFRGMLYYANGTIHPVSTDDTKSPVYAFNNANVVNGTFAYSDTANSTRSTVAMVKYTDPKNGWKNNVAYVEDVDGILRYGYNQKDMSAFGCTTQGQAYRLGAWTLETERLLTETVTFQTSLEGLYVMPGDVFAVYDNFRNNRTQAGRVQIRSTGGSQITLDRPVALDPGITYSLTCIVPEYVLGSGDITGSNQIPQLRNPQIQSFKVIDSATTSIQKLTVQGQFSSGLYVGSPWILAASGNTGIFNKASFYTCLATSEIQPGIMEVLGLQANTGITFNISTGYTVIDQPPNAGNSSSIQPPTNFAASWVTGALADNTFYSNLAVSWTDTQSSNVGSYAWSGQTPGFSYSGYTAAGPNGVFPVGPPGTYNFKVAAVSEGGVYSTFATTNYVIPNANPFGTTPPLSGVFIFQDADPFYANQTTHALTGYVGTMPGVEWNFQQDTNRGTETPVFDLITGYRVRISGFDGTTNYLTPNMVLEGNTNSSFVFPDRFLYTGLGGVARRGFDLWVDTLDQYGGIATGGHLKMNNEPPGPPTVSGFIGFNGGISYNVVPPVTSDISGIYIWYSATPGFVPAYGNQNYVSDSMAGLILNGIYQTGNANYKLWFALTDTFGYTGCPIYGPVAMDSNGSVTGAYFNLNQSIQQVQATTTGVSGSLVAYTNAQVSTVMTALTSTGVALGQRVDIVSANLTTTGATLSSNITSVQTALTTTGSALAQWITFLGAQTSGANASVTILTSAMVTGSVGGIGGTAIATWGFALDANGKGLSVRATTSSFPGTYNKLAFSGVTLESSNFIRGSQGWQLDPSGNFEGNNVIARGSFTGGAGNTQTSINADGFNVGNLGGIHTKISTFGTLNMFGSNGTSTVASLGAASVGGHEVSTLSLFRSDFGPNLVTLDSSDASVQLNTTAGVNKVYIRGTDGNATFAGLTTTNTLAVSSTATFNGAAGFNNTTQFNSTNQFNAGTTFTSNAEFHDYLQVGNATTPVPKIYFYNNGTVTYITENNGIQIAGDASHPVQIKTADLQLDNGQYLWAGTYTTLGSETLQGYITLKDSAGNLRKLAVIA